ncbi:general transcription repressor [Monosporozyma unispora]|nr:general transcription repressor [Kazachstania unispora]
MSQSKIDELLDSVRQEFARLSQNADSYRLQNQKDYDFKINQQLAEMQQIRNTVYELELTHRKMKDDYDEELNRIKLELEQKDRQIQSLSMQNQQQQQYQQNQQQQLQIQQIQQQQQVAQQQQHTTSPPVIAATFPSQVNRPLLGNNNSQSSSSNTPTQQPPNIVPPSTQGATTLHPIGPPLPTTNANGTVTSPVLTNNAKTEPTQLYQPNVISSNQTTSPKPTLPQMNTAAIAPLNQTQLPPPPTVPAAAPASATVPVPATATTAAPATKVEEITPVIGTQTETNSNYLVPYNERSNNLKPIPPYLLDLDPTNALEKWKKVTQDYYILYNPALPRNLDVDLHMSFDHSSVVCCVRFSNDGQFLATGCNRTTQVYNVASGELICSLSDDNTLNTHMEQSTIISAAETTNAGEKDANSDLYIRSVCFSPDGKLLATGAEDKLIRIWDIEKKKIVMVLKGHGQDIYSLDYFPSGNKLVSGSGDKTVKIWDLVTGTCTLTLSIEDGVTTVAVSPGAGKYIAAGSLDRAVRVWDSDTGFLVERLDSENELNNGHKDSVYSVVFTRDGNGVISGSLDRSVKLWNLASMNHANTTTRGTSNCEVTYMGHKDFVLSLTTSENDEYILSGSKDRGVIFWDTQSGNSLLMLQGHRNSVISVAMANNHPLGSDYHVFATGSGDCKARIWKYRKIENVN